MTRGKSIPRSRLLKALAEAVPHVIREEHGRHEQDRADSQKWQADYADIIRLVRNERDLPI